MASPKVLLIGRSFAENPELKSYLGMVPVQGAFAYDDKSAQVARQIAPEVATMTCVVAIVADFPTCIAVNDDGSISPILLEEPQPEKQTPLIELIG